MKIILHLVIIFLSAVNGNVFATFAVFQVSSVVPDVICNIVTGVATGTGAGTCASFPAACNNSGDDTAAFATFNTWAVSTWQAAHTGLIELYIPPGSTCRFVATSAFASGIKRLFVQGSGATFNVIAGINLAAALAQRQDNLHSTRLVTVLAGASTVTVEPSAPSQPAACATNVACVGLFAAGQWVLISGIDIQGLWQVPFGYPSNAQFFEYVQVASVSAGAGTITFSTPLSKTYKSTWPNYNSGSSSEVDNGGPATLYSLDDAWDTEVEYYGLTINLAGQVAGVGRLVTFRNVTLTGQCVYPTQNKTWRFINVSAPCAIEADKLIETASITSSTISNIAFQSSSIDLLYMTGSTVTSLVGTPRRSEIYNSSFTTFRPGAYVHGRTDETICNACTVSSFSQSVSGLVDTGLDVGIASVYTMSGGIISAPNGSLVSAAADNGGGKVRLTVASSIGLTTGKYLQLTGVYSGSGGGSFSTVVQMTIVDGTHIDLLGVSYAGNYTSLTGGVLLNNANAWAIPGTNVFWTNVNSLSVGLFQVQDVTQEGISGCACIKIQTSEAGGFPSVSGNLQINVHPSPKFTCVGCAGDAHFSSFNNAVAAAPLYSYQQYTYTGLIGLTPQGVFPIHGNILQATINVSNAYSGAGALSYTAFFNQPSAKTDYSILNYSPIINAKTTGTRTVTLSGVAGTQTGDSGLVVPDATRSWFGGPSGAGPAFSVTDTSGVCPGAGCPSVTAIIQTDQGVVNP